MDTSKIHNNLIETVGQCLNDVFITGYYADKVIEYHFRKNKQFGSRDRKFIAEATYDCVRNFIYLKNIANIEPLNPEDFIKLVNLYLAIFHEVKALNKNEREVKKQADKNQQIRLSYPKWLYEHLNNELGEETWAVTSEALHKQADVIIRCNSLKTKPSELVKKLKAESVKAEIIKDNAILITERTNLFKTEAFKKGLFEVQDYSSQQVAIALKPKAGEFVIDACAGAGGKSLHIADLMQNKGKILCLDIGERKLDELKVRAKRNGYGNIETRFIKNNKTIKRLKERADKLLLDVPCTGLGVLKRNPDTKYKLTTERIAELLEIQANILDNYQKMLKVGGELVYSTCSILPDENTRQVKRFLKEHKNFEFIEDRVILPQEKGFDGFYLAKLKKLEA